MQGSITVTTISLLRNIQFFILNLKNRSLLIKKLKDVTKEEMNYIVNSFFRYNGFNDDLQSIFDIQNVTHGGNCGYNTVLTCFKNNDRCIETDLFYLYTKKCLTIF